MQFKTSEGKLLDLDPTKASHTLIIGSTAGAMGDAQPEPAVNLRAEIERTIREAGGDTAQAAMAVCVMLNEHLDLAENGWFDNDEAVQDAIIGADLQDD